ncbi:MAG: helix-turn-helix transcriptional regulator [Oscillospiraceae bacterium]|nr:helix-turn-helix transcriptional regulator [Oscillospiraceae bacterium]
MNPDYKQIGRRIREERLAAGISQADLAELADVSPQYISLVENGRKQLSLTVLVRIADVLSASVDWLLFGYQESAGHQEDEPLRGLLSGCTGYERRVVLDIASAAKKSLTENRRMLSIIL